MIEWKDRIKLKEVLGQVFDSFMSAIDFDISRQWYFWYDISIDIDLDQPKQKLIRWHHLFFMCMTIIFIGEIAAFLSIGEIKTIAFSSARIKQYIDWLIEKNK